MLKERLIIALCALGLISCRGGGKQQAEDASSHAAPPVYLGTVPCDDCEGIELSITLDDSIHATYMGEYAGHMRDIRKVTYTVKDSILTLNSLDIPEHFALGDGTLTILDVNGNKIEEEIEEDQSSSYILRKRQPYNFPGTYTFASPNEADSSHRTLSISPEGDKYRISISGSQLLGKGHSDLAELGTLRRDTIFVPLGEPSEGVTMCIAPSHDQLGVTVFTKKDGEIPSRVAYSDGRVPMPETYYKSTVTKNSIGDITSEMTLEDIFKRVPAAQIELKEEQGEFADDKYDVYTIYTRYFEPLFSISPKKRADVKQRVHRVTVLNPLFHTAQDITTASTFGDIKQAYSITRIEPDKKDIVVVVDDLRASFSIPKSKLPATCWDEKTKTVNSSQIPSSAPIRNFILWWE